MKSQQITSLHFAVRLRVLCKYGGHLLMVFSLLTCTVLIFSLLVGEDQLTKVYAIVIVSSGLAGFLLQLVPAPHDIQHNEALVLSAAIFIMVALIVSWPFQQAGLSFIDALFESISGITTTGLSTLPAVEDLPQTFLFSRAWLQWTGGLGIVVLSVALPQSSSQASLRLFNGNWDREDLVASTKAYARLVLKIYLLLTLLGVSTLLLLGIGWQAAVSHILASVSTGGFSTYDNSLSGLGGWPARAAVIFFCLLGSVTLGLYHQGFDKGWRRFMASPEVAVLLLIGTMASLATIVSLVLLEGFSPRAALLHGPLLAFSAQTTAGFSSLAVSDLSPATQFMLIMMMFIGGNLGSTAGGIKIMRLLIVLKMSRLLISSSGLAAGAVVRPRYAGKSLEPDEINRCYQLIFLFLMVIVLSWLLFMMAGYPPLASLFEVVSATATVGLSAGITSIGLPWYLKAVLCLDMLMGRLEIIAFLVVCYPPTWVGKKRGE